VNLVSNALDAMADQPAPRLDISARRQGERIELQVRDRGPGLAEEARSHLFEPFFTTKDAGSGLGLGLAISAGIVADFGGSLTGDNHAQGGAVFTLDLPIAPEPGHE
jgi:two-component system C4-dicarboxylate transport sensor histidine kinase DctB